MTRTKPTPKQRVAHNDRERRRKRLKATAAALAPFQSPPAAGLPSLEVESATALHALRDEPAAAMAPHQQSAAAVDGNAQSQVAVKQARHAAAQARYIARKKTAGLSPAQQAEQDESTPPEDGVSDSEVDADVLKIKKFTQEQIGRYSQVVQDRIMAKVVRHPALRPAMEAAGFRFL